MANSRLCSIPVCGKKHKSKGFCGKHYRRLLTHGDPLTTVGAAHGEPEQFYQDVVLAHEGGDCLAWPYSRDPKGYGRIRRDGNHSLAHRLVCEDVNGPPPTPKHQAAHSCGNGHLGCVTKGHLSWKTRLQNKADELTHGTRNRGERHGFAKLTEAQAREIRIFKGQISNKQIAAKYGVSTDTVSSIHVGKTWGWLP